MVKNMFLRIKLENSNEVLEIPFAEALSKVRNGEAKFIRDDLIDGGSLNDVFFAVDKVVVSQTPMQGENVGKSN